MRDGTYAWPTMYEKREEMHYVDSCGEKAIEMEVKMSERFCYHPFKDVMNNLSKAYKQFLQLILDKRFIGKI